MKIGHYMPGIWEQGGVASYIRRVSGAQSAAGHTVLFFDLHAGDSAHGSSAGTLHRVSDESDLLEKSERLQLDILHVHTALASDAPRHVPLVRTLHGHQPYCPSGSRFLKRTAMPCNRGYSLCGCAWGHIADRCGSVRPQRLVSDFRNTWAEMKSLRHTPVIAVSHFLKQQMERAGYPPHLIQVLYLPAPDVQTYTAPPSEGTPRFVFLGRITPPKGLPWLLNALARVRTAIHLDIAGTGYQEVETRSLAERLELQNRVTFHGWQDERMVRLLIGQARAVVFPSLWHEPGGTVAFEAMVNGRALIMSRVGGMPEVVHDQVNGLLVEPNNQQRLTEAIERLAQDWDLARRLGEAGRSAAINSYSLQQHTNTLMSHYDRISHGSAQ